jgi:hypothetical protein
MPSARVIDRDPRRAAQASTQHIIRFRGKGGDIAGQKPQDLALGDHQPKTG